MEGKTLTVTATDRGEFPTGTEVEVVRHHINQFGDRETIKVRTDDWGEVKTHAMFMKVDGSNRWREIVVGRDSDEVTLE